MRKQLSYEHIESKPLDFDFAEGYGEKWSIPLPLSDEEQNNEEYTPMMNYIYPLGERFQVPDDFRKKLNNTTIIKIDDEYYLALTGGGMDFSWEICESYINLGYYPPAHFCRLPAMADRGTSDIDARIIFCCNESLRAVVERCQRNLRHNAEVAK